MFGEMVIKIYFFLCLQSRHNQLLKVGRIYIHNYFNIDYALYVSVISKNQIVYWHLYAHADDDTLLGSALKQILVYFQDTFYSLFNETVSTFDHLLQ